MLESQRRKIARHDAILSTLAKLDYANRSQLQRLHDLRSDRNARKVLDGMREFISSFRSDSGENVYHLNKSGRERVNSAIVRNKLSTCGHYLMRNDAYIYYGAPADWKNEARIKADGEGTSHIIVDSYFMYEMRRHFLEVDHKQHMSKNKEKIERYKRLKATGVFQEKLRYFPRLVWITLTEARRKQLAEWCDGLDVTIHLWDEIR
ncbi:hypothetical protein FE782_03650 [Paenibacillus antri]|uniref:Replication-relaxation n=1 Tax=Paenibacillus antri TaxID=2582848 RepID=A0A5R9GG39_9BACL|nr:replication-relaxation family protein [Paenibacillus antri]TLS53376.1 hypothetical protein FE782_03650 [Paenibacillus antri]